MHTGVDVQAKKAYRYVWKKDKVSSDFLKFALFRAAKHTSLYYLDFSIHSSSPKVRANLIQIQTMQC